MTKMYDIKRCLKTVIVSNDDVLIVCGRDSLSNHLGSTSLTLITVNLSDKTEV